MADFEKVESFGTFGQIGADTLELTTATVDGKPPRLHIGRWTPDGKHARFTGFLSETQARELRDILNDMQLGK